jgi:hypothetical protein
LSDFERGLVGARLAGVSVRKTATFLGAWRATVSKVMLAYTNQRKTTSAKRNSGRNSTLTKGECRILKNPVSINHNTGDSRTEYST